MDIAEMNGPHGSLAFFHKYAVNLKASSFPVLTVNRRMKKTTDREIVLLGDSHSWGQGGPDYDGVQYYSAHMPFVYSKGYFARLAEHVQKKLDFYPAALIPFLESGVERICGDFRSVDADIVSPVAAAGFYAPCANADRAIEHLGLLAEEFKFGSQVSVMAPWKENDGTNGNLSAEAKGHNAGEAKCQVDMAAHASKMYIGVLAGPHGAKLEVTLRTSVYYAMPPGYPKVFRAVSGELLDSPAFVEGARIAGTAEQTHTVLIDTFAGDGLEEVVYCIDYGMKQKGTLSFRVSAAHEHAVPLCLNDLELGSPAVLIRGVVFDGNRIRNFSMGGHTVGQWLGDGTDSYNDGPYAHIDEIMSYVPFTPTLAIIQAPVVNEYLRQTEISTFMNNMAALIHKLNNHHNRSGNRKMDVLMFTTLGDREIQFNGAPSLEIKYDEYFAAVKRFCTEYGYGLIDFRQSLIDAVEPGMLDYELLFDDAIHPSPFTNEFVAKGLVNAIDLLM